ncbi:hypothetical protein [Haladaptatus caseinilyticus]|uniref:hypothetical protein n=1 Tax=Haladaptatus caseinilyticus TaxID=2993314 RepID=UPI00224B7D3F|nr:hypothetical protein [Haladaptatus caseinilyticus]
MSRQTTLSDGVQRTLTECAVDSTERDDTPTTEQTYLSEHDSMSRVVTTAYPGGLSEFKDVFCFQSV